MNGLLKFITCGSVDDGKSTLIGHMLYDAKLLFADQEQALELDSKAGSRSGKLDYSLLLDGLIAEREQGITIDVAYRYFTTQKRSFIVADTPGHEEYTRNMAVGASFADLAVILMDATQGILVQTRRHARICELMGIEHFVFAVNKMDLAGYEESVFRSIEKAIGDLVKDLKLKDVVVIPVSATEGDNVTRKSETMSWYHGKTLLEHLETVDVSLKESEHGFVMPVQRVCRPDHTFRGFQGKSICGSLKVGDTIKVYPSGQTAHVERLLRGDRDLKEAGANVPLTITLDREIDISRGDVITRDTDLIVSNMFHSTILWMDDQKLITGKNYIMKIGTRNVAATLMKIDHKIDVNTGNRIAASELFKNEIAECDFVLQDKVVFDEFKKHKGLGSFILIDRLSNMTSACGTVSNVLIRSEFLVWHEMTMNRESRSAALNQKALTLWFTGLSGSGKSTLASELEKNLAARGMHCMTLDGDNVRMGLNRDLSFSIEDRIENVRRVIEVCRLMNDAGLIVLTSFVTPFEEDRQKARSLIGKDNFVEIYVSTPLEECERRDVKGLYQKAREGIIPDFTGISSPFAEPVDPDITIDTTNQTLDQSVAYLMEKLERFL